MGYQSVRLPSQHVHLSLILKQTLNGPTLRTQNPDRRDATRPADSLFHEDDEVD